MCQSSAPLPKSSSSSSDHHPSPTQLPFPLSNLFLDSSPPSSHETPSFNPKLPTSFPASLFPEAKSLLSLSLPLILTSLLLYSRSMISMLFLGRLGPLPLAGGSLAIGFANITGYSVLSGLATGMDPICTQSHGAGRPHLLSTALRRTILLLLLSSLPISFLWLSIRPLLLLAKQHPSLASAAHSFLIFSLPDLILQSFLHPIRIFLRSQSITLPLTTSAAFAAAFHFPINLLLVSYLNLGVPGVALSSLFTNSILLLFLILYLHFSGLLTSLPDKQDKEDCGWRALISLAIPSCFSICLEWWWYEIMVLLCGYLLHPQSTVASMGVLIQTTSLIYIFPHSLSAAVSTRVGNELGANRPENARWAARVGLSCGGLLGLTAFLFSFSVRNIWAQIFTADVEIVRLTASVLPILGLCELGNCPQTTGCGVLRGSARPRVGANINLGSFYGVGMPVAVGLAFWARLDFKGLWFGLLSAQSTCLFLMLFVIGRTNWESQAVRAKGLTSGAEVMLGEMEVEEEENIKLINIKIEQCKQVV
ncbi:protein DETOXIFICATION 49-like [Phalaenopsis equestris]|uniref:protein DETOXIFICATION 49-like n=1 Tax=Phalaenopsis equestris TaxID=78828 RepID=UPI0009E3767F|nr:protein DETOXIFICATION 49-like [Phalaenopsis equestris]